MNKQFNESTYVGNRAPEDLDPRKKIVINDESPPPPEIDVEHPPLRVSINPPMLIIAYVKLRLGTSQNTGHYWGFIKHFLCKIMEPWQSKIIDGQLMAKIIIGAHKTYLESLTSRNLEFLNIGEDKISVFEDASYLFGCVAIITPEEVEQKPVINDLLELQTKSEWLYKLYNKGSEFMEENGRISIVEID